VIEESWITPWPSQARRGLNTLETILRSGGKRGLGRAAPSTYILDLRRLTANS
jgi:hypothetical protein